MMAFDGARAHNGGHGFRARNGRQGFFFTGAAAVLLVILTVSVMLWISAANARSAREPLLTQSQALGAFEKSLNDYDGKVLMTSSELTLYDVVENAKKSPSQYNTLTEANGDFCAKLAARLKPSAGGTAGSWGDRVTQLGSQLGLAITLNFGTCSITQVAGDAQHVQVTYPLSYSIVGSGGSPSVANNLLGVSAVPIQGYDDPMVYRESGSFKAIKKFFFKDTVGTTQAEAGPNTLFGSGLRGKGFAYGKTARNSDSLTAAQKASSILVTASPTADQAIMSQYAGVIITVAPTLSPPASGACNGNNVNDIITEMGNCVDCLRYSDATKDVCTPPPSPIGVPFLVEPGFSLSGADRPYVLIDSQSWSNVPAPAQYHRIMDVEQMRAMAVCGFYVASGLSSIGPNFMQRLLNAPNPAGQPAGTGIEGFAVGRWANNNDDADTDSASSVDYKYYATPQVNGAKMKGMPGCRTEDQCSYSTPSGDASPVGHFALDASSAGAYGASQILCDAGSSCEQKS